MPTVALIAAWKSFPFYMIVFLAGLQEIPQSLYEAARVDGAGALKRLRHITLPLLGNTTGFVLVIATIAALQAFDQIYILTNGGPFQSTQTGRHADLHVAASAISNSASHRRSPTCCWWRRCCSASCSSSLSGRRAKDAVG